MMMSEIATVSSIDYDREREHVKIEADSMNVEPCNDCIAVKSQQDDSNILLNLPTSDLRSPLQSDGFILLHGVLTEEECAEAISIIWDFVEDTSSGRVDRNDQDTWHGRKANVDGDESAIPSSSVDPWPSRSIVGSEWNDCALVDDNGAGWLLGNVREILADRVFCRLFGTDQLHCSKEGFLFRRPSLHDESLLTTESTTSIAVDDVRSENIDLSYARSLVAFEEQTIKLATHDHANIERLHLNRGDVLLYRSDLRICSGDASSAYSDNQASLLCTMQPSRLTPLSLMKRKMEAYRLRATGDHRPDQEHWCSLIRLERDSRPFYRTSPPLVSIRQAQLYGLLPYSREPLDQERALIQGVRFLPELTTTRPSIRPCAARLEYLYAKESDEAEMVGQDKYLGGMASPCGRYVYGVPGTAKRVMRIHCNTGEIDFIGPQMPGKFKWLRGVEVPANVMNDARYPDGCCFALPCNASSVLKVNPYNSHVSTFGQNVLEQCGATNGWLYHGGNLASNGWVYTIPANASRVMKFHPVTDECQLIGPDLGIGCQKFYGGIVGADDCIYGIPHNERFVLKIDPSTDEVALLKNAKCKLLPSGQWKWHGGLRAGNKIIGFPNNADDVLVIDVAEQSVYTIGMKDEAGKHVPLQSGRHRVHKGINKYKYLGGSLTLDGRFAFLFPCDAERVLRIDQITEKLSLIGPLLLDGPNKFQNGFTARDGCCYGVPQRATGILRITPATADCDEDHVDIMDCGPISGVNDKFEGGVMPPDGNIYCIPLRAKACVRIIPACS